MKKALISAIAIALFALPMSLQAGPGSPTPDAEKAVKPLSTMKSTIASPSQADPASPKGGTDPATTKKGKAKDMLQKMDAEKSDEMKGSAAKRLDSLKGIGESKAKK